jgi:hypothetical protein
VLFSAGLIIALVWPFTDLIAAHDVGRISTAQRAASLQTAREAVRSELFTLLAGIGAAGALLYTARNFILSRRTVELTEQGQVTDRYSGAVEQLGSGRLVARLGGIYALERVARDSPRDHPIVMEVLAAFVREYSKEPTPPTGPGAVPSDRKTPPDVEAAVTVLACRTRTHDSGLQVVLSDAQLPGVTLIGKDLSDMFLTGAQLTGANLGAANLHGAALFKANLTGAVLTSANLDQAELLSANLSNTELTGAKLAGAKNLSTADFTGAKIVDDTPAPEGWVKDPESNRLRRVSVPSVS